MGWFVHRRRRSDPDAESMPRLEVREEPVLTAAVDELFRLRYRAPAPDFPHHVVAWWVEGEARRPLCYIHFTAQGELLLGGGACVDNRLLRRAPESLRRAVRARGGLYYHTLDWALQYFAADFKAVFGYCGDALAERVDRAAGFEDTGHVHLLVHWLGDVDAATRARLIAQAQAVGPF